MIPLAFVVAVAENGVIGAKGALPWRIRSDLRLFRQITMGKPLIMGRRTFESIGHPLDGRDNIVVSRQRHFAPAGVLLAHDLDAALAIAGERAAARGADEISIIGGGEVFQALMPSASWLHLTHVAAAPEGDVFFPEIPPADWVEVRREDLPALAGDTAAARYALYRRRTVREPLRG